VTPLLQVKSTFSCIAVANDLADAERLCYILNKKQLSKNRRLKVHLHPKICKVKKHTNGANNPIDFVKKCSLFKLLNTKKEITNNIKEPFESSSKDLIDVKKKKLDNKKANEEKLKNEKHKEHTSTNSRGIYDSNLPLLMSLLEKDKDSKENIKEETNSKPKTEENLSITNQNLSNSPDHKPASIKPDAPLLTSKEKQFYPKTEDLDLQVAKQASFPNSSNQPLKKSSKSDKDKVFSELLNLRNVIKSGSLELSRDISLNSSKGGSNLEIEASFNDFENIDEEIYFYKNISNIDWDYDVREKRYYDRPIKSKTDKKCKEYSNSYIKVERDKYKDKEKHKEEYKHKRSLNNNRASNFSYKPAVGSSNQDIEAVGITPGNPDSDLLYKSTKGYNSSNSRHYDNNNQINEYKGYKQTLSSTNSNINNNLNNINNITNFKPISHMNKLYPPSSLNTNINPNSINQFNINFTQNSKFLDKTNREAKNAFYNNNQIVSINNNSNQILSIPNNNRNTIPSNIPNSNNNNQIIQQTPTIINNLSINILPSHGTHQLKLDNNLMYQQNFPYANPNFNQYINPKNAKSLGNY